MSLGAGKGSIPREPPPPRVRGEPFAYQPGDLVYISTNPGDCVGGQAARVFEVHWNPVAKYVEVGCRHGLSPVSVSPNFDRPLFFVQEGRLTLLERGPSAPAREPEQLGDER